MRADDFPEVRKRELFRSMSDEGFARLMHAAFLQTFPAQVQLITEGDHADFLFVLVEGGAELYARTGSRETTMAMIHPVGTFILAAVIKDAVNLMSARTVEKSRILMIAAQNIRALFEEDVGCARAIVMELATCYRAVVKAQKNLKLRSSVERLANRLLKFHHGQGETGQLVLPYDKKTLASLLNMTPGEPVARFAALKPYGVDVDNNRVRLGDLAALTKLAKPNPLIDGRL